MNQGGSQRNATLRARMLAGPLAHLGRHMETGCPRTAYLATMLLEQVDEILELDPLQVTVRHAPPSPGGMLA